MPLGPAIRRLFGPYERQVGDLYRSWYMDLGGLAALVHRWSPAAVNILEVGCGEGAVTERLAAAYPSSAITAIDITERLGRLYAGPKDRVKFVRATVEEISAQHPGRYDLILLSDVLHHVPLALRQGLLESIRKVLAPGGQLVFKDWERNLSMSHGFAYASDRFLTGDKVRFLSRAQMRQLLSASFGESSLIDEARIAPRWNNLATLVRPG